MDWTEDTKFESASSLERITDGSSVEEDISHKDCLATSN